MKMSRSDFGRRYLELIRTQGPVGVPDDAMMDEEYEGYEAIVDALGSDGKLVLVDGHIHVLIT